MNKMKKTIIKITLLFCLFAVFSCSKNKGGSSNNNNNNTPPAQTCLVSTMRYLDVVYSFQYDASYNLIAILQRDTLGVKLDSMYFVYASGQMSGMRDYGTGPKFVVSGVDFTYNSSNQISQYYYTNVANATADYYYNYTYKNNQINGGLKYTGLVTSGVEENSYNFTYDNNGNINEIEVFDINSNLTDKATMSYDSHTSIFANLPQGARLVLGNGMPYVVEGKSLIIASNTFLNNNNVLAVSDYGTTSAPVNTGSYAYTYNSNGEPESYTYTYTSQPGKKGVITYTCH